MATFEVREIDAWGNCEDGYEWNASYFAGEFSTKSETTSGEKRAFCNFLRKRGVYFKPNRTLINFDGSVYEIIDRKTKEPIYAAIPKD